MNVPSTKDIIARIHENEEKRNRRMIIKNQCPKIQGELEIFLY